MKLKTDLATEIHERFEEDNVEVKGVILEKESKNDNKIEITKVIIQNEEGSRVMERPMGTYITIEFDNDMIDEPKKRSLVSRELYCRIKKLIGDIDTGGILVTGLGNREVTPDSLGPLVTEKLDITRHIIREFYKYSGKRVKICAISPGVMGQTGIETLEIIKAVVDEVKPSVIIAIDALAARNIDRLNRTVQVTDTGICPGSGVGNNRSELSKETLGIEVIAIGVPTVVDAWTIVRDRIEQVISEQNLTNNEKEVFISQFYRKELSEMFVTTKNIDESIKQVSKIIAEAVNRFAK